MSKLTLDNVLTILIAMLLTCIVLVWAYTVQGKYGEKTKMYNTVLDMGVECAKHDGTFNYNSLECVNACVINSDVCSTEEIYDAK